MVIRMSDWLAYLTGLFPNMHLSLKPHSHAQNLLMCVKLHMCKYT